LEDEMRQIFFIGCYSACEHRTWKVLFDIQFPRYISEPDRTAS